MVSARANEYITRFSKGVQKNTALKKIVEYRDECKGLYHAAESKNPMNYRAAEDKREYLRDMINRIECLAEARDYLQNDINKKAPAKKNNMHSAVAFVPEKQTKPKAISRGGSKPKSLYEVNELKWGSKRPSGAPTRCDIESLSIHVDSRSYFMRTTQDKAIRGKSANVIKYIMRYQHLGLPKDPMETASACLVIEAIDNYVDEWDTDSDDREYAKRAEAALEALGEAKEYFEEIEANLDYYKMDAENETDDCDYESESEPTKKPTKKHYKRIESETSWENFDRMMGRT
jgi:hypothetical protein